MIGALAQIWLEEELPKLGFADVHAERYKFQMVIENTAAFMSISSFILPSVTTMLGWTEEERTEWLPRLMTETEAVSIERHGPEGPVTMDFVTTLAVGRKPL